MDWVYSALIPVGIFIFGYIFNEIRMLKNKVDTMATQTEIQTMVDDRMEYIKEKIEDNIIPLAKRMDIFDQRMDILIQRIDKLLDKTN